MSPSTLAQLRSKHPRIIYRSYSLAKERGALTISFEFLLEPELRFTPSLTIPVTENAVIDPVTDRLAFLIGMMELLSYWKLTCSAEIVIACGHLTECEVAWWKELYRNGLGEFFYLNQISPTIEFSFITEHPSSTQVIQTNNKQPVGSLILVGGGKDSIVTLEAANTWGTDKKAALCVNPIQASLDAIRQSGYESPLIVERNLDPQLRILNQMGYLNGHTPYSALLAFVSTLVAYQNGFRHILASNETSASEGNAFIGEIEVNHQYSKSIHFEKSFREYPFGFPPPAEYLSFLRPLNELQICAIFALHKNHHALFRSCNREQTQIAKEKQQASSSRDGLHRQGWCGTCPKCIFTAICLACFLPISEIIDIFGTSPFETDDFELMARQLTGNGTHKPFECVGTFEEVQSALNYLMKKADGPMFNKTLNTDLGEITKAPSLNSILSRWDSRNYLDQRMEETLKNQLQLAQEGLL